MVASKSQNDPEIEFMLFMSFFSILSPEEVK